MSHARHARYRVFQLFGRRPGCPTDTLTIGKLTFGLAFTGSWRKAEIPTANKTMVGIGRRIAQEEILNDMAYSFTGCGATVSPSATNAATCFTTRSPFFRPERTSTRPP